MDFTESKAGAAREIALAFGVPPLLLGLPGDNTFSNYGEANRAFWRQTVLPLVARVQKSFQAWLQPGFGPFRLDYNADRLEALASERAAEWERVGKAGFLTLDEQREAVGYGPAPKEAPLAKRDLALERRYRPDQPRVPAGSSDGGRWTDDGGGGGSASSSEDVAFNSDHELNRGTESRIRRVQNRGYDLDLAEEEHGLHRGHTIRDHVGKSDENLKQRSLRARISFGLFQLWKPRIGTFPSLGAANKLVNSALSQNTNVVDDVISGRRSHAVLEAWFKTPTGKEAFAPKFNSSTVIRDTYGVRVLIKRDRESTRGFRIFTAYPINPD
jgi:hypothetical protein